MFFCLTWPLEVNRGPTERCRPCQPESVDCGSSGGGKVANRFCGISYLCEESWFPLSWPACGVRQYRRNTARASGRARACDLVLVPVEE